jgi:hypothetical protein
MYFYCDALNSFVETYDQKHAHDWHLSQQFPLDCGQTGCIMCLESCLLHMPPQTIIAFPDLLERIEKGVASLLAFREKHPLEQSLYSVIQMQSERDIK